MTVTIVNHRVPARCQAPNVFRMRHAAQRLRAQVLVRNCRERKATRESWGPPECHTLGGRSDHRDRPSPCAAGPGALPGGPWDRDPGRGEAVVRKQPMGQAAAVAPTQRSLNPESVVHNDTAHGKSPYAFALARVIVKLFSKKDRIATLPALYAGREFTLQPEHAALPPAADADAARRVLLVPCF